ncbi:hypothetical protein Acr_15g0015390 [Actinidia rufa]|uniref:Uncharacterized protein n=1 Tax=Actinidia rufa TaxID=165716 RepID=A0A7J0FW52_9ERIC|nr:hypothetical protein Acr_15g0015390 [Actinidia rufa]
METSSLFSFFYEDCNDSNVGCTYKFEAYDSKGAVVAGDKNKEFTRSRPIADVGHPKLSIWKSFGTRDLEVVWYHFAETEQIACVQCIGTEQQPWLHPWLSEQWSWLMRSLPIFATLKRFGGRRGKVKAVAVVEVKGMEVALVEGWEFGLEVGSGGWVGDLRLGFGR